MINYKLLCKDSSKPPNMVEQVLGHPNNRKKYIELGVFNEHRFCFYLWAKWKKELDFSPDLISFDWHQDFLYPSANEKKELELINLQNLSEISFFSWARLNPTNDNHISSATYLNLLNDIWVVCKQDFESETDVLIDFNGEKHLIHKFKTDEELFKRISEESINGIFFDIDLDYFTIENSTSNDKEYYTYIDNKEINRIFSIESDLIKWIFNRIYGITIALEPEHTGGISKSMELLSQLEKLWFINSIGKSNCKWLTFDKQNQE